MVKMCVRGCSFSSQIINKQLKNLNKIFEHKKLLPLKRILVLPTWIQIHTVSVMQPFISDFFQMEHPVRWSFIQEKFSPFLSSLFCRKNSSSKPRRINTISNNEGNQSPLHNVILQDVIVHNYATVNHIKKVVSFFISKTSVLKTTFSKNKMQVK